MRIEPHPFKKAPEIHAKRVYLPFLVWSNCPHCGYPVGVDMTTHQYLSYPTPGEPQMIYFAHQYQVPLKNDVWEDHEWEESVILRVSLEVVGNK
jgi:hypothetical protein